MNPILYLDYAGIAVFAATGALAASRKQLDVIGFLFLAGATGIGGGTLRDLILGAPVFWVKNSAYVLVCAAVAILVFFSAHRVESRWKLLLWLDAIGLSVYAVMGAAKGLAATGSPTIAVVTGMLTATFGGILRDCWPASLRSCSARKSMSLRRWQAPPPSRFAIWPVPRPGFGGGRIPGPFAIRGGAIRYGWTFPPYKSRPGRRPEDIP